MFKEAKNHCNHLTIALHQDPSVERFHKLKPVQSTDERKEILMAIEFIDEVKTYSLEKDFLCMLNQFPGERCCLKPSLAQGAFSFFLKLVLETRTLLDFCSLLFWLNCCWLYLLCSDRDNYFRGLIVRSDDWLINK